MQHITLAVAFAAAVVLTATAGAVDMLWDGGDGEWHAAMWNGGNFPNEGIDVTSKEKWNGLSRPGDTATISSGNVQYIHTSDIPGLNGFVRGDPPEPRIPENLEALQGTALTINNGASLTLVSREDDPENWWTQFDISNLTLDNGTFQKIGEPIVDGTNEGGGAFILGSWDGDNNFPNPPPPETINISMTNGSVWNNVGQVWFGANEDNPKGLIVNVTINGGDVDFTGGDTFELSNYDNLVLLNDLSFIYSYDWRAVRSDFDDDGDVDGDDLLAWQTGFGMTSGAVKADGDWDGDGDVDGDDFDGETDEFDDQGWARSFGDLPEPYGEEYTINFTGPGSITVDSGILVAVQNADSTWEGGDPSTDLKTYEELWDLGILQANGLSGLDGETFSDYFTETGSRFGPDYRLDSLVGSGGASGVPEPASAALACLAALAAAFLRRRRI